MDNSDSTTEMKSMGGSGVARSLVLAGHLLYASLLASLSRALRARLRDMSGTDMVLWAGTCPARPALRYATDGKASFTSGSMHY